MVRKCLNSTAADNADLGMTAREGFVEMNTWQGTGWIAISWPMCTWGKKAYTSGCIWRRKGIWWMLRTKEFAKFRAQTRNGSWTNTWPMWCALHIATYTNSIWPWSYFPQAWTIIVHSDVLTAFLLSTCYEGFQNKYCSESGGGIYCPHRTSRMWISQARYIDQLINTS